MILPASHFPAFGQAVASGGGGYLLDTYTNSVLAFSFRKLRSAYSGNCIQVRRSSDNTTQNIGFVGDVLDTASLLSFVGANDGFIVTWYDQSPTANHVNTANTAAFQSRIVVGGVLQLANALTTTIMDGNEDVFLLNTAIPSTTAYSCFAVLNINTDTADGGSALVGVGGGGASFAMTPQGSGNARAQIDRASAVNYLLTPVFAGGFKQITFITAPAKNKINLNNTNLASNTTATNYTASTTAIGNSGAFSSQALKGAFSELILFTSDEDANASAIASEQMAYYGL